MPLCIDLFCGLGGWTEGFLAEGYRVIGFDIERHQYGEAHYQTQLVLQDVLTLHGSQFRHADVIVASPPCQAYSYRAMPWKRAKALPPPSNDLFDACFRIQAEACAAAGRHVPMVVENVKGAQPWVGRAAWHFGSFYLWGDVPAVMPIIPPHRKVPGVNFHAHEKGIAGGSFQSAAVAQRWREEHGSGVKCTGQKHGEEYAMTRGPVGDGVKQRGSGPEWFDKALDERRKAATLTKDDSRLVEGRKGLDGKSAIRDRSKDPRKSHGNSNSRKAASAMIAKIPEELSRYIARFYRTHEAQRAR
jgi:hypothetical protein